MTLFEQVGLDDHWKYIVATKKTGRCKAVNLCGQLSVLCQIHIRIKIKNTVRMEDCAFFRKKNLKPVQLYARESCASASAPTYILWLTRPKKLGMMMIEVQEENEREMRNVFFDSRSITCAFVMYIRIQWKLQCNPWSLYDPVVPSSLRNNYFLVVKRKGRWATLWGIKPATGKLLCLILLPFFNYISSCSPLQTTILVKHCRTSRR